jgi:hypothetical protein
MEDIFPFEADINLRIGKSRSRWDSWGSLAARRGWTRWITVLCSNENWEKEENNGSREHFEVVQERIFLLRI